MFPDIKLPAQSPLFSLNQETKKDIEPVDIESTLFSPQEKELPLAILHEVQLLGSGSLGNDELLDKLGLIANKAFSLETKESKQGTLFLEKIEKEIKNLQVQSPQITEALRICTLLKEFMNPQKKELSKNEEILTGWSPRLNQMAAAQASKTLQNAASTLDNLQLLRLSLTMLALPDKLEAEIEALKNELAQLSAFSPEQNDSIAALAHLQAVHLCKQKLNEKAATIRDSINSWEAANLTKIDVDIETDLAKEYGYKHARLIELSEFLSKAALPNVDVPVPRGISDVQIHAFFEKYAPAVDAAWTKLDGQFNAFQKDKNIDLPDSAFLQLPEVEQSLKEIKEVILAGRPHSPKMPF